MLPAKGSAWTIPNIPWTELLGPLPSPVDPQPGPVKTCRKPSPRCVDRQVKRLRRLRDRLGCDHRAVFATTYLELTRQFRRDIRAGIVQRDFFDPRYLYTEDALFANFYFDVIRAHRRGEPVPEAWRVAFAAAADGNVLGAQDMLLGINAHVNNDMPFVLAALGLRTPEGRSRKPDHDAANGTLNRAYERVVAAIRIRYDRSLDLTNIELLPVDDIAGLELVRAWREVVWRNAERLVNARSAAERGRVAAEIERWAGLQARLIAAVRLPGYGATRDAWCARGPSGG